MTQKIMGILNVTPNSFSDGGDFNTFETAIAQSLRMLDEGAEIIDVGGESTKPGSESVSLEDELSHTIPVIKSLISSNPEIVISIDTTKYEVAKQALDAGAKILNDISGLSAEPRFVDLAKEYDAELIIMHIQGTPRDMQIKPHYDDVVTEVYDYLAEKAELAKGVKGVYVDVGIGFGKNLSHNITLLNNLEKFNEITGKQLLGISRKSFIKMMFGIENPKERDAHTALFHSMLLQKNVEILRVHNVKLIREMLELNQLIK